jgi:hypothetical protein
MEQAPGCSYRGDTLEILESIEIDPSAESLASATRKAAFPYKQAHDAINIIRAIKAARITAKLNLLIRLSYASTQPISPSLNGIRLSVPTNPLVFTYSFYQTAGPADSDKELSRKTNLSPVMETLENAGDVTSRTKSSCALQVDHYGTGVARRKVRFTTLKAHWEVLRQTN